VAGFKTADDLFRQIAGNNNKGVKELFGFVADDKSAAKCEEITAAKGKVIINDFLWNEAFPNQQRIAHVSIDRFTGGALDSALFTERPLWRGTFPAITILILEADRLSKKARLAFKATLDDLVESRLALGGGAGRGLGYFEPKETPSNPIHCSAPDGNDWFNQGKES
jgi:RAMP superfamily